MKDYWHDWETCASVLTAGNRGTVIIVSVCTLGVKRGSITNTDHDYCLGLSDCLYIYLSIFLYVCLSIYLSVCINQSINLSIYLSVCVCVSAHHSRSSFKVGARIFSPGIGLVLDLVGSCILF